MGEEDFTAVDTGAANEEELYFVPVDLSEAGDGFDNTPVPDGEYAMIVKKVNITLGKSSGNPFLKVLLQHTGENENKGGVFTNMVISGKGAFRVKSFLTALGFSKEELTTLKIGARAKITEANRQKGVPATIRIGGENVELAGRNINVVLKTENDGTHKPRNDVESFLA